MIAILIYLLLGVLAYTWGIYPLLLWRPPRRPPMPVPPVGEAAAVPQPHLVILIAAFNEGEGIAARIHNLFDTDYPADRLTVLVGTDGCTDNTVAEARRAAGEHSRVMIHAFDTNRGKTAVLRDLVREVGQMPTPFQDRCLLVFTDANTRFRRDTLHHLIAPFHDPAIGGVCGRLVFKGATGNEETAYWDLETRLKRHESALDSCLGANGAIYAIRPDCFWQDIPENTIVDDFVIGMKVREAGRRMHYEPGAVAEEEAPALRDEWARRVRIGRGDYQAALLCKACLHPRYRYFAWSFWSHKILRWFTPHILLLLLALAAIICLTGLGGGGTVRLAAVICLGHTLLMTAAMAGRLWREIPAASRTRLVRYCRHADHFVTMQAALMTGFIQACRGNLAGTWQRTPRTRANSA